MNGTANAGENARTGTDESSEEKSTELIDKAIIGVRYLGAGLKRYVEESDER